MEVIVSGLGRHDSWEGWRCILSMLKKVSGYLLDSSEVGS